MPTILRRTSIAALVMVLVCPRLSAQAPGRWGCRVDSLSGFNCAQYYNGTVSLVSELRGSGVRQSLRIVATVTGGRVQCRVTDSENGEFEGAGMMAVTHEASQVAGGGYSIDVWCPEEAGGRTRRGTSAGIRIMHQRAADYAVLEGRDAHEHPDTDATNGLSGTETITWSLRRP